MSAPGLLKAYLHLKKLGQLIVWGEDTEAAPELRRGGEFE